MGSLGDKLGRKRSLIAGLLLFAIGSILAGLSKSTLQLILMRGFTGIAGAIIMPATLSLVSATFRENKERSQAIALWAATLGLGVGVGPVLGGWLLMHFPWNSVFFVNVPVIGIALAGSIVYVAESRDENAPPADLPGVALSIIGLVLLLFAVIQAGVKGWTDPQILQSMALAVIFLAAFAFWESRARNAMLPIYLFKNMSFTGANFALTMIMFNLFGASFFLSQYFQTVLGHNALQSGLALLPLAAVVVVTSALSNRVADKLGVKMTVAGAILVAAVGLFYLATVSDINTSYPPLLLGMVVIGIGVGTATGPATDSVIGAVPLAKAGVGSAMNDTTRELGGALGVAVLGTVLNGEFLHQLGQLTILDILPPKIYATIASGIVGAHQFATYIPLPQVQQSFIVYVDRAFVSGMKEAMLIGAVIMVASTLVIYLVLPAQIMRPESEP
jgi:EmrB/QacA subfamily drug resistance transporter